MDIGVGFAEGYSQYTLKNKIIFFKALRSLADAEWLEELTAEVYKILGIHGRENSRLQWECKERLV